MGTKKTVWVRLAAVLLFVVSALAWTAPRALAAETVDTYVVDATVSADGQIAVRATISFQGAAPASLQQQFSTALRTPDNREYRFEVSDIRATAGGTDLAPQISSGARQTTVVVPTAGVTGPVELSYVVKGAAIRTVDGDTEVTWALLQGLNLPVTSFDATVKVPSMINLVDCAAGAPEAPKACIFYGGGTHDNPQPFFHDEARAPGEIVQITVRFPEGAVAVNEDLRDLWTFERAFSAKPLPLGVALGVLALGGLALWLAHRKIGRDAAGAATPTPVAEFHPVADGHTEFRVLNQVRPGQVGTVMDEHVDPVDVTATLIDLAVRGHLRIEEMPRTSAHAVTDWTFVRRPAEGTLADYERILLDAVAPAQGEPVKVSNLAGSVVSVIPQVQSELYDEVVQRGWFARRPDSTRNRWALIGWAALGLAVIITIQLAAVTTFGLTGLALVALALGLLFVAQEMPARTAAGASLLSGLNVLRGVLLTQRTDQVSAGKAHVELSRVLPYAVVLGGLDRWLDAMVAADADAEADSTDLDWYHAPNDWHLSDLPASVKNFVTTVQGTLFSR